MIFVTGGTGFIGSYLISELVKQGYAVRAIRRRSAIPDYLPQSVLQQVEWVSGDVLDVTSLHEQMEGADAVIHAAAKVSFNPADRADMFKVNIEGTANIVNTAIDLGITRLLYVSSVAALGRENQTALITEEHQWVRNRFQTNYAISKYNAEMEVWRGMAEGLSPVIVNPSIVLGYGDWTQSSVRIFKSVYDGFPWYTEGIGGFVDVRDVAVAVVELMKSDIKNERFILNGDHCTYQSLFNLIADRFGAKRPAHKATALLSGIAWRMEKLKSMFSGSDPLLTKESARMALSNTRYDNSKVRRALPGFQFRTLDQTIGDACQDYLTRYGSVTQ